MCVAMAVMVRWFDWSGIGACDLCGSVTSYIRDTLARFDQLLDELKLIRTHVCVYMYVRVYVRVYVCVYGSLPCTHV